MLMLGAMLNITGQNFSGMNLTEHRGVQIVYKRHMLSIAFWYNGMKKQDECFLSEEYLPCFFYIQSFITKPLTTSVMKTGKSRLEIHEYLMHMIKMHRLTVHEGYFTAVTSDAQFVLQMH